MLESGLTVASSSSTNHNSLLRKETNEITSFCIDHRLRQKDFFRFRQSGQRRGKGQVSRFVEILRNKKGFSFKII